MRTGLSIRIIKIGATSESIMAHPRHFRHRNYRIDGYTLPAVRTSTCCQCSSCTTERWAIGGLLLAPIFISSIRINYHYLFGPTMIFYLTGPWATPRIVSDWHRSLRFSRYIVAVNLSATSQLPGLSSQCLPAHTDLLQSSSPPIGWAIFATPVVRAPARRELTERVAHPQRKFIQTK